MNSFSLIVPADGAAPVVVIVARPPCGNAPETVVGKNAPASAPAAEAKGSAAAAKTDSRVYNRVDVFDPAQTVEWLRDNGYANYVITTDPRPHKGMVMQLLKAGHEIPGCRLAASDRGNKNDRE